MTIITEVHVGMVRVVATVIGDGHATEDLIGCAPQNVEDLAAGMVGIVEKGTETTVLGGMTPATAGPAGMAQQTGGMALDPGVNPSQQRVLHQSSPASQLSLHQPQLSRKLKRRLNGCANFKP